MFYSQSEIDGETHSCWFKLRFEKSCQYQKKKHLKITRTRSTRGFTNCTIRYIPQNAIKGGGKNVLQKMKQKKSIILNFNPLNRRLNIPV